MLDVPEIKEMLIATGGIFLVAFLFWYCVFKYPRLWRLFSEDEEDEKEKPILP